MDKSSNVGPIIIGVIVLFLVVFFIFRDTTDWNETYIKSSQEPYGTNLFHDLIKKSIGEDSFIVVDVDTSFLDTLQEFSSNASYVFVGDRLYLTQEETEGLLDFAKKGNSVYLLSNKFDKEILDTLFNTTKTLLKKLIRNSFTAYDDTTEVRIPCGYYADRPFNIYLGSNWVRTNFENPNGYFDINNDWVYFTDNYEEELSDIDFFGDGFIDELIEEEIAPEDSIGGYYAEEGRWITVSDSSEIAYDDYLQDLYFDANQYFNKHSDSTILVNLFGAENKLEPALGCTKIFDNQPQPFHPWGYFNANIEINTVANPSLIGYFNSYKTNYMHIEYGEGDIYLHSTPILFTNYMLRNKPNFEYAKAVFEDLDTRKVIWDESNRYEDPFDFDNMFDDPKFNSDKGPLSFILSETGLKIGWYIILGAVFLYFMFGFRRKQRVIPVIVPNVNTSIEYAETIAQLYMKKGNHSVVFKLKMNLFKQFLRDRYGLNTNTDSKETVALLRKMIVLKSDINEKHINNIFETYKSSLSSKITTKELVYFHDLLEVFYKKCK